MDNDDEYITWPATGSGIVAAALSAGDYHAVITCYGLADESYAKIILTDTGWLMVTDEELAAMQVFAKHVAVAIKKVLPCIKVGQAVLGLEVPHAHIHLVPMNNEGDLDFDGAKKLHPAPEQMEEIAEKIRKEL